MKEWYKSKTLWFGVLTVVVGVATAFGFAEFSPDPEQAKLIGSIVTIAVGVINVVLRKYFTDTKLG